MNKKKCKTERLVTFNENGERTGEIQKGEYTTDYLKCCTCFISNERNQILVEKRGNTVLDNGKLDLCSGHVRANETSTTGMIRELGEELGIEFDKAVNIKKIGNLKVHFKTFKCLTDVFFLKMKEIRINPQDEEVEDYCFMELEELLNLIRNGKTRFVYTEEYEEIFKKLKQEMGILPKENNKIK